MYEKKNKLRQPVPILDKISAWLSDAVHPNSLKLSFLMTGMENIDSMCPFVAILDAVFTFYNIIC